MKRLLLVLFVIASVTSAFAAELKITGDMFVQGNSDTYKPDGGTKSTSTFVESDLTLNAALVVNENLSIFTRLTYDNSGNLKGEQKYVGGNIVAGSGEAGAGTDVGLAVERAYMAYKVAPFLTVSTGLMATSKWGTNFSDTDNNAFRVVATIPLSADMIFLAMYEKNKEGVIEDGKDNTTYYLSAILNAGPVKLMPLVKYVNDQRTLRDAIAQDLDAKTYVADVAAMGNFGTVGFEAEVVYVKAAFDATAGQIAYFKSIDAINLNDKSQIGAYLNVFANLAPAKVGFAGVYQSSDPDKGSFSAGNDFNFTIIIDDVLGLGAEEANYGTGYDKATGYDKGMTGMTAAKLYGEFKMDKITLGACLAYGQSTNKDVFDVNFYEVDAKVNYAFDANASYEIGAGYASITDNTAPKTTDTRYRVYHKMAVKF